MVIMFRKWIPTAIQRRFGKRRYNFITNEYDEGFYYSFYGKFMLNLLQDLRQGKFNIMSHWRELDTLERQNMRAALFEQGLLGVLAWIVPLLYGALG
jgi:hypothetical protein